MQECVNTLRNSYCGTDLLWSTVRALQTGACQSCCSTSMRKHMYTCLQKGELTMFLIVKERVPRNWRKAVKSTDIIPIYCDCRMPEDNSMVQCSECEQWYNIHCVDVPKAAIEDSKLLWFCNKLMLILFINIIILLCSQTIKLIFYH